MKVLILVEDGFDELEFYYPYLRLKEDGIEVDVAAPAAGKKKSKSGMIYEATLETTACNPKDYQGLYVPGGQAPDRLRRYPQVLQLVKQIHTQGGIVGSICHGPHVLISAAIVKGVRMTSVSAIKDDLINAGALWIDQAVVEDERIITSRTPVDLPAQLPVFLDALKR